MIQKRKTTGDKKVLSPPKTHDAATCGLCRTDHPMMRFECAADALDLAAITVRMKEAGTAHLMRFKQGRRVSLSRAQVLEHRRIGLKKGACNGECAHVFEEKSQPEVYESDC